MKMTLKLRKIDSCVPGHNNAGGNVRFDRFNLAPIAALLPLPPFYLFTDVRIATKVLKMLTFQRRHITGAPRANA